MKKGKQSAVSFQRSAGNGCRRPSRSGGTRPPDAFPSSQLKRTRPPAGFHRGAFTLLELLVVVGLIGALAFFVAGGLTGGGQSAALQSGQALLANLITATRTAAAAGGQSARLLVQVDPGGSPTRYLRCLVVQVQAATGWQTELATALPDGVYVVPGNFPTLPAGLFAPAAAVPWTKADGSALRSTALRANQLATEAVNQAAAEQWVAIVISAQAGTVQSGDLILAAGRRRAPGSYAAGDSPVELLNPETVRGLTLSAYAVPILINARLGF